MKYSDKAVVTPLIYDQNYIPFLIDYCQKNKIQAIIPLFDIDLPILAKNINEFKKIGVRVIVSNIDVIAKCNDKWKNYLYLKENGFSIPHTFLTLSDTITAIDNGIVSFPIVIKPRWGMGSLSIFEADNVEELNVLYKKTINNIHSTYLKYNESQQSSEFCVILQEN